MPHKTLVRNLVLFVLLKVLGSFDSGAFSASLNGDNGISEDWGLSVAQQGTLSSSVFLGNMIGCAIAGHLFSLYSAKLLLFFSLIVHGFFTFLFASAESYEFALLCRFFIGVTLAFIVVYTPVWVDAFAPKNSAATWMALQNAGVPLGIMLGFVMGGLLPTYTSVSWEWTFFAKVVVMVPIVAIVGKTDRRALDNEAQMRHEQHRKEQNLMQTSSPLGEGGSHGQQQQQQGFVSIVSDSVLRFRHTGVLLLQNGVFISNMLSLSGLYFVVSGLQTFVTSYLRAAPFNASMDTIVIGFGCAVVTAPVFGVICGGIMLDRIGGYHGNILRASKFALGWGIASAVVAVSCIFITETHVFLMVVWVLLFCGGAIIPPGSGINMASLPEALRPTGSSVAQMSFNFLGNFSGPLLCGWISELSGSLTWGVRAVFSMAVVGVIPMMCCTYFASRRHARSISRNHSDDEGHLVHPDQSAATAPFPPCDGDSEILVYVMDGNSPPQLYQHDSGVRAAAVTHRCFAAPQAREHHVHCCTANMSVIGALEEAVESGESPRNSEDELELAPQASKPTEAGGIEPQPPLPASQKSSNNSFRKKSERLSTPPRCLCKSPSEHAVKRCHFEGSPLVALMVQSTLTSPQLPQQHSSSFVHNRTNESITTLGSMHRYPAPAPVALGGDAEPVDDEMSNQSITLDSGNFNMSFPSQHSFGLNLVRGLLGVDGGGDNAAHHHQGTKRSGNPSPNR